MERCKYILNELYDLVFCNRVLLDAAWLWETALFYGSLHEHRFAIRFQLFGV